MTTIERLLKAHIRYSDVPFMGSNTFGLVNICPLSLWSEDDFLISSIVNLRFVITDFF